MPPADYAKANKIRELKAQGMNQTQIGNVLGISQTAVSSMCRTHNIKWNIGAAARDQSGNKNPNFIDGLSKSSIERKTREIIKMSGRCLYTCERCGDYNKWQEQHRHHKDRDRSNNTNGNLEVLCTTCHNIEHMTDRNRNVETGRFE